MPLVKEELVLKKQKVILSRQKVSIKLNQSFIEKIEKKLNSKIKKNVILKNMGWCDDPKSTKYNQLINFPFKYSAEKLYRKDNIYDIILVIEYNMKPIKKNKGSAIFLHITKQNFKRTEGCVAIKKKDLKKIILKLNKKSKLIIS